MRNAGWAPLVAMLAAGPALAEPEAPRAKPAAPAESAKALPAERPASPPDAKPASVRVPPLPQGELLARLRARLKARASTVYEGWPAQKAIDGDPKTSWFSASGDAAALKTAPWIEVSFPEDVTIQHVLALGNREPDWLVNYSIVVARLELYDHTGLKLATQGNETALPTFDIEFHLEAPVPKVRRLRLVSLSDQGDKNPYRDVAIGELWAW
ncbi:MAG: discoidin domain-containing protein [Deltaproteobacteria bacterium]|nr:discoidin domain-containing protein [Deltaproteobacteria bacterium]